jgi:hypothetical protein
MKARRRATVSPTSTVRGPKTDAVTEVRGIELGDDGRQQSDGEHNYTVDGANHQGRVNP